MSASCRFCGKSFANAQAVRAHLKGCAAYQAHRAERANEASRLRDEPLGSDSLGKQSLGIVADEGDSELSAAFDPVRQLRQQITTERLRLELREVQDAHAERDQRADTKAQERRQQARAQAEARTAALRQQTDERDRLDRAAAEEARLRAEETARRQHHRETVQAVKAEVMSGWCYGSDLKAQALQEIERALSVLPLEDLPRAELVEIARGIRDRFSDQAQRTFQAQAQRQQHRQTLIIHGQSYAKRQLADVDGLSFSDRLRIEQRITEALEELGGTESTAQIEDLIEDILDREGVGWDDEDYDDE